ncbi:hypothetical protein THAOC_35960 [Thalassiosira oceanica]|uniref:Uncharacterized protein n=1 Tax=Thalassiosira oceanica TaxID=159749 RepID=K0R956_THAOC|nr:hypothetical protein THAOC_35960 [Thalassiosira oceanica]|eukprot:EJK45426.1 hypothetical protein THAOC_35960 [Thalassiosira oceanica]
MVLSSTHHPLTTVSNRNPKAALFWFLFLSISYASERSTFKLLVDRVGPFRLFSVELILGGHALLTGIGMGLGFLWNRSSSNEHGRNGIGLGLPLADVGLMAVLDTVYLLLAVISGAHVPPVLTVVLVQTTIPLTACFTQCVHPDGRCSRRERQDDTTKSVGRSPNVPPHAANQNGSTVSSGNVHIISNPASDFRSVYSVSFPEISSIPAQPTQVPPPVKGWGGLSKYHIIGTAVMFLAIFIGLTPAVLSLNQILITKKDAMPERTAYNTIIYCLASIPAAVSQLYKEHTLTQLRQPVDRDTLNLVLSIFQLLFAIIVSPLAYGLQGMGAGDNWTSLYPSKSIGDNFHHGLRCFAGILDESTMKEGYPEPATCRWSLLLVFGHALSIVMVGISCDKLAAATKVMYRGVSFGIICSVIFMFVYQISDKWCEYGPLVSLFHLTSTALLIVGAEVYHRVSLADSTFETVYPSIDLFVEGDGIEH